jgi:ribosomal protein L37AE/L43A
LTGILSYSREHQEKIKKSGRCTMAGSGLRSLPRENPCAQCGRSISLPEWIETEPGRTFYLWRCMACDYRFEAVAYFDQSEEGEAIAA